MIPAYYDAPDRPEGSVPMRGDDPRHESMFSYVTPEARVRADHPLRPAGLKYKGLARESKHAFRKINLRWHDLRHEYASRLVERGVPLAQVRDLLGHASITTTERYDNQKLENLQMAAAKLESGLTFEPSPRESTTFRLKPEATGEIVEAAPASRRSPRTKFQESFTIGGQKDASTPSERVSAIEANDLENLNLGEWLGVRDGIRNWLVTAA